MNVTLLSDGQFDKIIMRHLTYLRVEQTSLAEAWDIFKEQLKLAATERSSQLQFARRQRENARQDILKKTL